MHRAYSILDVKALDDDAREIAGIASTPAVDRDGDVLDPLGARFEDDLPLLWQHRADAPVGRVQFDRPSAEGIRFRAALASVPEPGTLRDRLDEAWQSVKHGLVRAVSVGFRTLDWARMESGGLLIKSWEVLELSLVTIPANHQAVITAVKSLDTRPQEPAPVVAVRPAVRVVRLAREKRPEFVIRKLVR